MSRLKTPRWLIEQELLKLGVCLLPTTCMREAMKLKMSLIDHRKRRDWASSRALSDAKYIHRKLAASRQM